MPYPKPPSYAMPNLKKPLRIVSLLLAAGLMISCASSPVVTTVACPKLPPIPPSLQEPPQSLGALEELQAILERWQLELSRMRSDSPVASNFSETSEIF